MQVPGRVTGHRIRCDLAQGGLLWTTLFQIPSACCWWMIIR